MTIRHKTPFRWAALIALLAIVMQLAAAMTSVSHQARWLASGVVDWSEICLTSSSGDDPAGPAAGQGRHCSVCCVAAAPVLVAFVAVLLGRVEPDAPRPLVSASDLPPYQPDPHRPSSPRAPPLNA